MDNEDLDALAAEYVLGTLAPDERAHAEALIAADPGFVDIVHQWERRLGELNVMVEAVEPPAEIWDKIKSGVATTPPSDEVRLVPTEPTPPGTASAEAESNAGTPVSGPLAALAASLEDPPASAAGAASDTKTETQPPETETQPTLASTQIERSADVVDLSRRMRRWRRVAVVAGALAAVLAALIVVSQVDPALIPPGGYHIPQLIARASAPSAPAAGSPSGSRLVAVLQQEPSAPAFLLTIDPARSTLTVRRVAAKAAAGHSYELWLIPAKSTTPQALGVIGEQEYTQPKLPANVDLGAARAATYAVSFEAAGGSKTGAPTGPILFTGKLVESVPPPAAPKT